MYNHDNTFLHFNTSASKKNVSCQLLSTTIINDNNFILQQIDNKYFKAVAYIGIIFTMGQFTMNITRYILESWVVLIMN
jgi:hypothetical protein